MRTLFKGLGFIPLFLSYLIISSIACLLPAVQKKKRAAAIRTMSVFARMLLVLLGVRVHATHLEGLQAKSGARLIVSNHLSYIDVLVIASLVPSVFITSVELKNTLLLGTLARLSGSIFVERRRPAGLKHEIEDIALVLGQGMPVALFPEGTTSDGDRVRPFKKSLFDAAVLTRANIMPVCLRYTGVNGGPLTALNRDTVFYYGRSTFLKHFAKLLTLKAVEVEVVFLNPIRVQAHHSRKELAAAVHRDISAVYHG